jgi:hypothetical protein
MLKAAVVVDEGVRSAKRRWRNLLFLAFPLLIAMAVLGGCTQSHASAGTALITWLFAFGGLMLLWGASVFGSGAHWVRCANGMCVSG